MRISSINSTLEVVELAGEVGRGEWTGKYDGGDIEGVLGGVSGLFLLRQSEESRVLLEEAYWDVGIEKVHELEKKVD